MDGDLIKEEFPYTHVVTEPTYVRLWPPFTGTLSEQTRPVMELAPGTKVFVVRKFNGWAALNPSQNLWVYDGHLKQRPDHHP